MDRFRRVGVRQRRIGRPVHAGDLLGVERHLFVQRPAERVQRPAFDRPNQPLRVDDEAAVVRTDDALHPDAAGPAIHFDIGDLRHHGLAAVGVSDSTAVRMSPVARACGDGRGCQPYFSAAALTHAMIAHA